MEGLEKELIASKVAQRMVESIATNSSKAVKVAKAKAVAPLSLLTASEIELEALRFKLAEMEMEMRDAMEKSKDAVFEEVEAIYREQVEQIKALVFNRGYDMGLGDAGV